jgi:hypothetical protein
MDLNLSSSFINFTVQDSNENLSLFLKNKSMRDMHSYLSSNIAMEDKIIYGFLVLLGLLIVVVNLQVLFLAMKLKFLRKKTNYIIISLAVSDLLSGALAIPLLVACTSTTVYSLPICIGMDVCQRFLAISTILHLAMAVLNRYFRIVRPFLYRQAVTAFRLGMLILSMWIISLTSALVQTTWLQEPDAAEISFIYDTIVLSVLVLVPFLIIVAASVRMFGVIKQRKHHGKKRFRGCKLKQSQRKAFTIHCIMTACFAIGWFPYFVLTMTEDLEVVIEPPYWLSIVFLFLKYGTSLVDPLLYTFLKTDFQKALKYVLYGKTTDSKLQSGQNVSRYLQTYERSTRSPESAHQSNQLINTGTHTAVCCRTNEKLSANYQSCV